MTDTPIATTETASAKVSEVTPPDATTVTRQAPPCVDARVKPQQNEVQAAVEALGDALLALADARGPELAATLTRMFAAVAIEASRSPRLARALADATALPTRATASPAAMGEKRQHRRAPGPFDPFAVFAEVGEDGLRHRLASLTVEELRNIIAEHRMDQDRLAMKWKDTTRIVERIVERIKTRSAKGDVFRMSP